ncbi:MAG: hypothetical protein IPI67_25715 [Myxococcales bacterium]|nr:hypothetical protein [Myxococcales bacterium]
MPRSILCLKQTLRLLGASLLFACSADSDPEDVTGRVQNAASVGGCNCPTSGGCSSLSYSDVPADGLFYVTTFGGGSDTQPMSCGGTADGTWAYVADSARFGCKAKLLVEAQGKSCVAEVRDCGPNRCVEQAACSCSCGGHFPILDASPFITQYLLGSSSVGWSEKRSVKVTLVDPATPIGCPGGPVSLDASNDAATSGGAGGGAGMTSGGGAAGAAGSGASTGGGGAGASGGSAGAGGAGTSGSAGTPGSGGDSNPPSSKDDAGGCSCRVGSPRTDHFGWLTALGAFAAIRRRRGPTRTAHRLPR